MVACGVEKRLLRPAVAVIEQIVAVALFCCINRFQERCRRQVPHLNSAVNEGARLRFFTHQIVLLFYKFNRETFCFELLICDVVGQVEQAHKGAKGAFTLGVIVGEIFNESLNVRAAAELMVGEVFQDLRGTSQ